MILAILQARVSSSRLPAKVLKPLLGQPMLLRQVERIKRSKTIDQLVIATSLDSSDDPIAELCQEHGLTCYRGELHDVLDRFYRAALPYAPAHVVRLTGDCPVLDPVLLDEVVRFHLEGAFDYASNAIPATFPDGLDVEVFRYVCLEQAWREATLPSQREHVTPFIHRQPARFKLGSYTSPVDRSHLRWTVDEPADLEVANRIYERLYPSNPAFTYQDILTLFEGEPDLSRINAHHPRNEGMLKSLQEDQAYLQRKGQS